MAKIDLSKTPQRAIIMAAGEATRWGNYLGLPNLDEALQRARC